MFLVNITQALNNNNVDYALVGGHAVAIHGAVRGTLDVDFILKWKLSNLKRAEATLKSLGLIPRLPVTAEDIYNFRQEYIKNRNLIEWDFYNPMRPSEQVDIIITQDMAEIKTIKIKYQKFKITVISKKDLIKMKKESNREQDILDIQALEKLQ
jgi:hypothetical protein